MVVKFKNPENCREIRRVYMAVYIMYHLYYVILRALCSVISGTGKTKNYIRWTQKAWASIRIVIHTVELQNKSF